MMAVAQNRYVAGIRPRSVAGIWFRHALVLRHTWQTALAWYFFEPFVALVAVGIGIGRLVEDVDGIPYALFLAPGVIAGSAMFHSIFECAWGAFFRIQKGVFETILTAPISTRELALGELSWAVTRAVLTAACVGVAATMLGWIDSVYGAGVLIAAALIGLQFGALGLIFAALAPNIHVLSLTFTVIASPLYFFSGAFFPISVLPDWVEPIAWAAPLTPAVHLARGFATGALDMSHLLSAFYSLGISALLIPIAATLLRRRLVK